MSSHSNQDLQKAIDSNSTLLTKMGALTQQLQTQLLADFEADMGVPVPSAVEAPVRQFEYSMVYSTDPIIQGYMSGAKTLLDGVFSENWPDVADKALDVVQVLLSNIITSQGIQTGASSQSMIVPPNDKHGKLVCAAFTEIQECSATDWATQTNFYVAYYVYAVWEPEAAKMAMIERSKAVAAS